MEFNVGDKVITNPNAMGTGGKRIGTVIKITPKRQDIIVDFGSYKGTFDKSGREKGDDPWYKERIKLITPEIEKELQDVALIKKCKDVFNKTKLTPEIAAKILEILNEVDVQ